MNIKNYNFDKNVKEILKILNKNNNKGYIVGGAIRDILLNKVPKDIDFVTNINYEDLKILFSHYFTKEIGKSFEILNINLGDTNYEIAKFRDNIQEENIKFDLEKRDFTINSMAYNFDDGLLDFFCGQNDLNNKIIKFVGNPSERIKEDGLRILRAFRFMSTLGFDLDINSELAIKKNINTLKEISQERITNEINKILMGKYASKTLNKMKDLNILEIIIPNINLLYNFPQNNPHHQFDLWEHTLNVFEYVDSNLESKWAALFHDIGKPETKTVDEITGFYHFYGHQKVSVKILEDTMDYLKQPIKLKKDVSIIVENHMILHQNQTEKSIKKLISYYGEDITEKLIDLAICDDDSKKITSSTFITNKKEHPLFRLFYNILDNSKIPTIYDLQINGYDLMDLGFFNKQITEIKNFLLNAILENKVNNDKDSLIKYVLENFD